MRKFALIIGLAVMLVASTASAEIVITLVGPAGVIEPNTTFDVDILVELTEVGDLPIAMVQVVLDSLDPSLTLIGVTAPLAGLSFINPPDTAVMDFNPTNYPLSSPGSFVAGTLQIAATVEGTYPLNLFVETDSSFSTAVFLTKEGYDASWAIVAVGDLVTVAVIPEPFTMGLMALVSLGGIVASRKRG